MIALIFVATTPILVTAITESNKYKVPKNAALSCYFGASSIPNTFPLPKNIIIITRKTNPVKNVKNVVSSVPALRLKVPLTEDCALNVIPAIRVNKIITIFIILPPNKLI